MLKAGFFVSSAGIVASGIKQVGDIWATANSATGPGADVSPVRRIDVEYEETVVMCCECDGVPTAGGIHFAPLPKAVRRG